MKRCKKPLMRSYMIVIALFVALLCVAQGVGQYMQIRSTLYYETEFREADILYSIAGSIDVDDLAQCIKSGVESEAFAQLRERLDDLRDRSSIRDIYIVRPLNAEPVDNILFVMAGASTEEYENAEAQPERLVSLNQLSGDAFSPQAAQKYLDAYRSKDLSFIRGAGRTDGVYTCLLPLLSSGNKLVAALCVDIDMGYFRSVARQSAVNIVAIVLLTGAILIIAFWSWTKRNVTGPLRQLEDGARQLAAACKKGKGKDVELPEIKTENEVQQLAEAMAEVAEALRNDGGKRSDRN